MTDPTKTNSRSDPSPPSADPVAGRRRLLQGGLAAGPVLMTLVSRPVLAQQTCTTPSGFVSANASTAGRGVTCSGQNAAYWADYQNHPWPSGFNPTGGQATRFGPPQGVFGNSPFTGNPTLLEVLSGTATLTP